MPKKKVAKKVKKPRMVKKQKAKPTAKPQPIIKETKTKSRRVVSWILMVLGVFLILLSLLGVYPSGDTLAATFVLIIGILLFWYSYKKIKK